MNIRSFTIRKQLIISTSIVVLSALVLASFFVYSFSLKAYKEQLLEEMLSVAQMVGINNQGALAFEDQTTATEILQTLKENKKIEYACLFDKNRKNFANYTQRSRPQWILIPAHIDEYKFSENKLELFKEIFFDGERIAYIYLEVSLDSIHNQMYKLTKALVLITALLYAFSLISIFVISQIISKPILHLAKITSKISTEKNYSVRARKMKPINEVGILYNGFNEMLNVIEQQNNEILLAFKEIYEQKDKIEKQKDQIDEQLYIMSLWNKDITSSISYARNIQKNMLLPINRVKYMYEDILVYFEPRDMVSGDFYWMDRTNGNFLVVAADCTGHGVPGAMISVIGFNLLNQVVKGRQVTEPNLILEFLDHGIRSFFHKEEGELLSDDGMDISIINLNLENLMLSYSGANNPVLIVRDQVPIELPADKYPLGSRKTETDVKFTSHDFQMQKGDYIYLFSDGFADQFGGPKGKKFMKKKFKALLAELNHSDMAENQQEIDFIFNDWKGDLDQVDDVLIIGIRI